MIWPFFLDWGLAERSRVVADVGVFMQRLPLIGDTFRKEIPPSDNVSLTWSEEGRWLC